jgi:hypothetical protein
MKVLVLQNTGFYYEYMLTASINGEMEIEIKARTLMTGNGRKVVE